MNRNSKEEVDENRIRKLFAEMRQQDEVTTPLFDDVLQSHSSASETRLYAGRFVRFAAIAAILILVCGAVMLFFGHRSQPQVSGANLKDQSQPIAHQVLPKETAIAKPEKDRIKKLRRVTYKSGKSPRQRFDPLISQWRSPTGFLLQVPNDKLLKTVPLLIDPALKMTAIIPSEKN